MYCRKKMDETEYSIIMYKLQCYSVIPYISHHHILFILKGMFFSNFTLMPLLLSSQQGNTNFSAHSVGKLFILTKDHNTTVCERCCS